MHNWDFKVGFVKDKFSDKHEFVQILRDGTILSRNPQLDKGEKVPLEQILEGHFVAGVKAYQQAKRADSTHRLLAENFLNGTGYELINQKKLVQAIDVFSVNTILYPTSENVYDSLAEAYLKAGQKDKAKENYKKVLQINPGSEKAIKTLETL